MCENCGWEEQLEELNDLCADNDYEWANDTLSGIAEWVEEKEHITANQADAIDNIKAAVEGRR
ncbi:MAG: hypothetical protein HW377_1818 [Actinobacteria bacterium]|nr:hypothetical protein [Actinomycetota bacterium]MBM2828695.1 hypothetical protein [Actinomycetota bacterium]